MAELLVITNADDFGLSHEVNAAVELLHQKGVLSSATIMANGSALDEVKAIHDRNPELGLGVHLNATNFRALTPAMRQSVLCDESGSFASNFRTEHRLSMTGLLAQEWLAQVTRLQDLGIALDHLDSHHHVHTWPAALPALQMVSKSSGIPWVRNTRNCVSSVERAGMRSKLKYAGKSIWSRASMALGLKLTGGFCSVLDYKGILEEGRLDLERLGSLELMCHPGDWGNEEYVEEVDWLSECFLETLKSGWTLGNYRNFHQH